MNETEKLTNDDNKLGKSIEIIKKFIRFDPVIGHVSFYHEEWENTKKTAEQFLNDCKAL